MIDRRCRHPYNDDNRRQTIDWLTLKSYNCFSNNLRCNVNIEVSVKNMNFLEAFASETRVKIIELLNEKPLNVKEIAAYLDISSAIVTRHIQKLEQAGIIKCENSAGKRGTQKVCSLKLEQATLQFKFKVSEANANTYCCSIPVGQYSSYDIKPTCGLASTGGVIGVVDDPRYFADPDHIQAGIIWFGQGFIEYRIPNYLLSNQRAKFVQITLEICSEAPGYNEDWPSEITFYLAGRELGFWTSPGDFGSSKGIFTPDWWNLGTQYGLMKTIIINETGSYVDGIQISTVTVNDLDIRYGKEILFRMASLVKSKNSGGVTLFGKGFGNYSQDIQVKIGY